MKINPHTVIILPDNTSIYTYKKSYFEVPGINNFELLFTSEQKATDFVKEATSKINDTEQELRHLETIVFGYFKSSDFDNIQDQKRCWILFENIQNSYFFLYRPYIKWHFVWARLNVIIDSLIELLEKLPEKKAHIGVNSTYGRLNDIKKLNESLAIDKTQKALKWTKGNPTVIDAKAFYYENN